MAGIGFSDHSVVIPGPDFHIDLAAADALHPVHYTRRLFIFRCASTAQREAQLAALQNGLKALVFRCPVLGGTVTPSSTLSSTPNQQCWLSIVPGPGIELVVRDLSAKIPSFQDLEKSNFATIKLPYQLLMPIPRDITRETPFAAFMVQFSAIDGGTILTITTSHSVADGSGQDEIMRMLAEEMRLVEEHVVNQRSIDVHSIHKAARETGLDRSILRNMTSEAPFDIKDHPGYVLKDIRPTSEDQAQASHHPFEATSPEIPVTLRFSVSSLARLKSDATQPNPPPISTHDALSALVWRSVLLIRSRRSTAAQHLVSSTIASLHMPSDGRRQLGLPSSYIGNAVYQLAATLDLETLLSPNGLQHGATAIRSAITAATPTLVSSYMAQVNQSWVNWSFLGKYSTIGVGMGTDWKSTSLYEHDWGKAFRPLVRYRFPDEPINCVYPKLPSGEAEVVVSVMPNELSLLTSDECFGRYATICA